MESLTQNELREFISYANSQILDAQLQKVWTDGQVLVLELYLRKNFWLCFDLNVQKPYIALLEERPDFILKNPKPVSLFLAAHGEGLRVAKLMIQETHGRVFLLELGSSHVVTSLEAWLIPKNVNLTVSSGAKKVSWAKPRELAKLDNFEFGKSHADQETQDKKDWKKEALKWRQEKTGIFCTKQSVQAKDSLSEYRRKLQHSIEKKEKAIHAIQAQLRSQDHLRYQKIGESLKYSEEIPQECSDLYDHKLNRAQNREKAFQKAKDILRKQKGTLGRLQVLQDEIEELKQKLASDTKEQIKEIQKTQDLKKNSNSVFPKNMTISTRKKILTSGFEVVMGKSAKDNLLILRQSRAWDLWLHLRDYPSAYAIVFRNKGQVVSDADLKEAAQWIVNETLSKKQILSGIKFDVVMAECRHVKPVKGSVGLVTYQNSRTFTFASK